MPFEDVTWALADLEQRDAHIRLCRDYYEGRHRKVIPESKTLTKALRAMLDELTDNLCDDVVDEPVSRTSITNWTCPKKRTSKLAVDLWAANRGDARAQECHRDHWAIGDTFVIVQRDDDRKPRFYPQRPEVMAVRYSQDTPDRIEVAAKCWKVGKRWRLTLYYPGETPNDSPWVERYATKGTGADGSRPQAKSFEPITISMGFGQPKETLEGKRFPVYHAPADELGRYGRSVLDGVIPLQDVLNKSVVDMVVVMEDTAGPMRWATGIQTELDPMTGAEKPLYPTGRERMLRTAKQEARFGQFPQVTIDGFLKVQDMYRAEIGRKGFLPPHSVASDARTAAPTGISLLVNEGKLIKRIKSAEDKVLEPFWRDVMAHLLDLSGVQVDAGDIDVEWAPAETRDEDALVTTLTAKVTGLGLPKRQALIEAGYAPDDVDKWLDEAQAKADAISGGRLSDPGPPSPFTPTPRPGLLPQAPPTPAGAPASGVGG